MKLVLVSLIPDRWRYKHGKQTARFARQTFLTVDFYAD